MASGNMPEILYGYGRKQVTSIDDIINILPSSKDGQVVLLTGNGDVTQALSKSDKGGVSLLCCVRVGGRIDYYMAVAWSGTLIFGNIATDKTVTINKTF